MTFWRCFARKNDVRDVCFQVMGAIISLTKARGYWGIDIVQHYKWASWSGGTLRCSILPLSAVWLGGDFDQAESAASELDRLRAFPKNAC
jgi:hypothetical protein